MRHSVLRRYVFSTCYYIGPLFDFIDANASAVPAFLEMFQYDTQLSASVDPFVTNILLQAFDQCRTNLSTRVPPPFLGTNYGPTVSIDASGGLPPPMVAGTGGIIPATGRTGMISAGPMSLGGSAAGACCTVYLPCMSLLMQLVCQPSILCAAQLWCMPPWIMRM